MAALTSRAFSSFFRRPDNRLGGRAVEQLTNSLEQIGFRERFRDEVESVRCEGPIRAALFAVARHKKDLESWSSFSESKGEISTR